MRTCLPKHRKKTITKKGPKKIFSLYFSLQNAYSNDFKLKTTAYNVYALCFPLLMFAVSNCFRLLNSWANSQCKKAAAAHLHQHQQQRHKTAIADHRPFPSSTTTHPHLWSSTTNQKRQQRPHPQTNQRHHPNQMIINRQNKPTIKPTTNNNRLQIAAGC